MNFSAELKCEDAAAELPYAPCPAPNLSLELLAPRNADVKRAMEEGNARQKRYGVEKQYPSVAHTAMSRRRMIAACEVAGKWEKFGGMGAQWSNLTFILESALKTS